MTYKDLLEMGETIYYQTDRLTYYKNPVVSERYFDNYLSYRSMPSLADLKKDLAYVAKEQQDYPSHYAFLFFAENEELSTDMRAYLTDHHFSLEKHLIFTNELAKLHLKERDISPVTIEQLSETSFSAYLAYKYQANLAYGETYANQCKADNEANLLTNGSTIYLAIKEGKIIGDITAWECGNYIEMDDFSVDEAYRGRGIGTALQRKASQGYKKVILISEEANRAMYEHQGYQEVAYYWTALKTSTR